MHDEFTARQRAITLRLSGRPVQYICQALGRSDFWFRKWWRRYLESGAGWASHGEVRLTGARVPASHRIIAVQDHSGQVSYVTKGDANNAADTPARPAGPWLTRPGLASSAQDGPQPG